MTKAELSIVLSLAQCVTRLTRIVEQLVPQAKGFEVANANFATFRELESQLTTLTRALAHSTPNE